MDKKIYYVCPKCQSEVWVDGFFQGYSGLCLKCLKLEKYDSIKSDEETIIEAFKEQQRQQENGIKKGWNKNCQKWFPHASYEKGNETIAYGHKIIDGENYSEGITENEAILLFNKDFEKHYMIAKKDFEGFTNSNFENCSLIGKLIAADITFNVGRLKPYKEFMKALKEDNFQGMINHCETSSKGEKLKARNDFKKQALMFFKK